MRPADVDQAKSHIRERVWSLLERERAAPPGVHGHIPAFTGAESAATLLAESTAWSRAAVVKSCPDTAQRPVRVRALRDGKILYMAVPALAGAEPFYLLDPDRLDVPPEEAASSHGAAAHAPTVDVDQMRPVDMVVCGSVAVDRRGARLGKGAGYSDIEVALLAEAGLVGPRTVIVTTVHRLQIVAEPLPEAEHDFRVDLIVTPDEVITCPVSARPTGLVWEHLSAEKIASIPVLAARAAQRS